MAVAGAGGRHLNAAVFAANRADRRGLGGRSEVSVAECPCRSGWLQAILIPGDQVLEGRAALAKDDSAAGTSSRTSRFLPGIHVFRHYRRAWLRGDVVAGCTVAAYLVPQVMAYAEVA